MPLIDNKALLTEVTALKNHGYKVNNQIFVLRDQQKALIVKITASNQSKGVTFIINPDNCIRSVTDLNSSEFKNFISAFPKEAAPQLALALELDPPMASDAFNLKSIPTNKY